MKPSLQLTTSCIAAGLSVLAPHSRADVVTDWNAIADGLIIQSRMGTPPAVRAMAIVQTAVHEAVAAAQLVRPGEDADHAAEAAVAAANRATLSRLLPQQVGALEDAYATALGKVSNGPAKAAGIAVGEQAAARVLAWRASDGATATEAYRPHASPGDYVPTTAVAAPHWPQRKPWLMTNASQFRPAPPPSLTSPEWARDFNEVKALGGKNSRIRTPEQTDIARFWEFSLPPIYNAVTRSVATAHERTVAQNARLLAITSQAMDDAVIAVLEAKYHYGFWRPVTAIRNGDRDNNVATEIEPGWTPLIDNPGHPEYPSAHSILAATVGELLKSEVGTKRMPELSTISPAANGASRHWSSADAFMAEVASARVWEGIHYRFSVNAGLAMGKQLAALASLGVAQSPEAAAVPQVLAPKAGRLVDALTARGTQLYECRADGAAPGGARWVFTKPRAELYDRSGRSVGKHYEGPHWEALDGSRIIGNVEARAEAPQTDAAPWLLLSTRSAGGTGRFAQVTSVQRVNTIGGNVPAKPCDFSSVGQIEPVQYSADYLLYGS